MNIPLTAVIAHTGPNLNGRIYTTECLQRMVSRINDSSPTVRPILVELGSSGSGGRGVNLMKVVGYLKDASMPEMGGRTEVFAGLHLYRGTPDAEAVRCLFDAKVDLAVLPVGSGNLDLDGTITNYEMSYASLVRVGDSAFPYARIFGSVPA